MALALYNRVQQTGTANTTVSFTLTGAITGYQSFAVIGDTNTTYYTATDTSGSWEVGVGTYSTTGPTLTRTTILSSSNSGSAVTFSGTVNVWVDYPAEKAVSIDTLATPPAIGGTTPAAVTATTLIGGGGSANYGQLTGGATTKAVEFKTLGSDTNVGLAIRSQGTGAIDLAAGSSGVNISNGGTVTALTRTANGSAYTGFPSIAISAPTTAGGVQATATPQLVAANGTVVSGGTGYTLSDVLTVTTSGGSSAITLTVTGVSGGVVTTATANSSALTTIPSGTVSVSGGTGSGATFNLLYVIAATFTITAAGSGYVEQPTVSFSGGGGSGATAYATVGSGTKIQSLGTSLSFNTPSGEVLRLNDTATTTPAYFQLDGGSTSVNMRIQGGTTSNTSVNFVTRGTGAYTFNTGASIGTQQFQISNTSSAVNYVQVTGAATGGRPTISAQGSDTSINMDISAKGFARMFFLVNGARNAEFTYGNQTAGVNGNHVKMFGNAAGTAPVYSVEGADADIDLSLTPKGAGAVRFGTYTVSALLPVAGYITIKDSGGTSRRLLVG